MNALGTPIVNDAVAAATRGRRLLILVVCSMSLLLVGLDATIVNVALPAIHDSFHSTLEGLQWTVDAYTLVLASLLMLTGSTADRFGRRRIFQAGLVVFSLGSLLCALAPSLGLLVAFRVVQAIGAAMLPPVAMAIVRNVFEDPRERAQAIGVYAAMFGISMALGPVFGVRWSPPFPGGPYSWSTSHSCWRRLRWLRDTCPSLARRDPVTSTPSAKCS